MGEQPFARARPGDEENIAAVGDGGFRQIYGIAHVDDHRDRRAVLRSGGAPLRVAAGTDAIGTSQVLRGRFWT